MTNIALDFDDVLSNTMGRWVGLFNEQFGATKSKDAIDTWDLCGYFGIEPEVRDELFSKSWSDVDSLLPLHDELSDQTQKLSTFGNVDIVTGINQDYLSTVKQWVVKHDITYSKIIHTKEKEKLDYDYYIDDDYRLAEKLNGTGKHCFLYHQGWNAHMTNNANITKVTSISEVNTKLKSFIQ